MRYTIEVRRSSGSSVSREFISSFDDKTFSLLWDEAGLLPDDWIRAQRAYGAGRPFVLLPSFPQLSRVASVDEGTVSYRGIALQELATECVIFRKKNARAKLVRAVVQNLLTASRQAQGENAEVVVHPFGV